MRGPRGGPGATAVRLARAERLREEPSVASRSLALLATALRHQHARAAAGVLQAEASLLATGAAANLALGRFPLLDLDAACDPAIDELDRAVAALSSAGDVPSPLAEAGHEAMRWSGPRRRAVVETWLDDPTLVEHRLGFWVWLAAAPLLEAAAVGVAVPSSEQWRGGACPVCGGPAQASVIAEDSGEFLGGAPRSLVCGRCATWWPFPRAVCARCGEDDPRNLASYLARGHDGVRVDGCETCHGYVKTFDLRDAGAAETVPLVDDVATLTLDVWANENGFDRDGTSVAGV